MPPRMEDAERVMAGGLTRKAQAQLGLRFEE